LRELFVAAVEGGFGSGFVVVHSGGGGAAGAPRARAFVVTNRHVVGMADHARIGLRRSEAAVQLPVVYVDSNYDVAVLEFVGSPEIPVTLIPQAGFEFEGAPASDQQQVVATGYPGIGHEPSYQVTRGYVSNQQFEVRDGDRTEEYVQHTAPIDAGSSGGPLLTEAGRVLGINTLKVRGRENVALAVPTRVVLLALRQALAGDGTSAPPDGSARAACDALAGALRRNVPPAEVVSALSAELAASHGFSSLVRAEPDEQSAIAEVAEGPAEAFAYAVAQRLLREHSPGVLADLSGCEPYPSPEGDHGKTKARFTLAHSKGQLTWTFRWEQRRWKLADAGWPKGTSGGAVPSRNPAVRPWRPSLR
jgi:serine protease Do